MNKPPTIHRHSYAQRSLIWIIGRPLLLAFVVFYKTGLLQNMKPRVRAIIRHGDHVLLVREAADFNRWTLPGGGAKPDESPEDALVREMNEELGLTIPSRSFGHIGIFAGRDVGAPHDIIVFAVQIASDQPIHLQYEILDAAWWRQDNLPSNLSVSARIALQS